MSERRAIQMGSLCLLCVAGSLSAQGLSPADEKEGARFEAVEGAVSKAGYDAALVVGHGTGPADALFAVLVTRGDSGLLLITTEPPSGVASKPAVPVVLEHEASAIQLGIRGVAFAPFLNAPGLWDIQVTHQPFMLEMTRRFDTHHVVRFTTGAPSGTLAPVCEFAGNATTTSSKGIGIQASVRRVTVEAVAGAPTLTFIVTTVEETVQRGPWDTVNQVTPGATATTRYIVPRTGMCQPIG